MILLDLKINPNLLNPNFDGYKLSLDTLGVHKIALPGSVDETYPSESQYSFLHHSLFALHNHLHCNTFTADEYGKVYFVDDKWRVFENKVNPNTVALEDVQQVWEIPANEGRKSGDYNISIKFVTETLFVASDGGGTLHIVNSASTPWEIEYSCQVLGKETRFILLDAKLETDVLEACLLSIEEVTFEENGETEASRKFVNVINWISLHKIKPEGWCQKRQRHIQVPGMIEFASLNLNATALYLLTNKSYTFLMDSDKPIIPLERKPKNEETKQPEYVWQQTNDDVTIWFSLDEGVSKGDVNISVTDADLRVTCRAKDLLFGATHQPINANLTTWKIEKNRLEIVLEKSSPVSWNEIVVGDDRGQQTFDPHEILAPPPPLGPETEAKPEDVSDNLFNMQQLEECDISAGEYKCLHRIDGELHRTTHQMSLGSHQCLFHTKLSSTEIGALCLRHDVDGCLLQIRETQDSAQVKITHEGTLHAFGYVQASKAQKKFVTCSPDMSYGVICESSRHIFLYVQSSVVSSELRHRTTGRRIAAVSKQHIVSIDNEEVILGVCAGMYCLYVLTSKHLYMVKLKLT